MRKFKRIGLETLESRFAPATLAGHTDFDWMTKQQAVPTVPVLGGLASSPGCGQGSGGICRTGY